MTTSRTASPLVAALLSSLCSGLGQLYCGRRTRALTLLGGSLLFAPVVLTAAWALPDSEASLVTVVLAAASFVGVSLFSVVDAIRLAAAQQSSGASAPLRLGTGVLWIALGVGYPVVATHALRAHVMEAYVIPTGSMAPALLPGDRVLSDRSGAVLAEPRRGDLVIFRHPDGNGQHLVKRVVGLPGEEIRVVDGHVQIDGSPLQRRDIGPGDTALHGPAVSGTEMSWEIADGGAWRVLTTPAARVLPPTHQLLAQGEVFVLGDHRDNSVDSRSFGAIPLASIEGLARYLWWPGTGWDRVGVLPGAVPPPERAPER